MTVQDDLTDTSITLMDVHHRALILRYASRLTEAWDRDQARVRTAAAPLLEWVSQSPDETDLHARMEALSRAHSNDRDRLARRGEADSSKSPDEFLAEARGYYEFLTAA